MSSPAYLRSTVYTGISDRTGDVASVESALTSIINAGPTQIQPDDREAFLDALLADLEPEKGRWESWPLDVYILSLTAIRILGRNPIGSTTLLSAPHLSTILYHSGLPLPLDFIPLSGLEKRPIFSSISATETLKILANLLLLHAAGRNRFSKAGGAEAIARSLAGRNASEEVVETIDEVSPERVFLLSRIGFLVTLERKDAAKVMVDEHHIVHTLTQHLYNLSPIPANFNALAELFKLAANLIRFYLHGTSANGEDAWDERFETLLSATLHHFFLLPYTSLSPPLSNTIQVLLFIPFLSSLSTLWSSVPSSSAPSSPKRSPSPSGVRNLLTKLSGTISTNLPRRKSSDESRSSSPGGLAPPRAPSPLPGRRSSDSAPSTRPTRVDPEALPKRLLNILEDWFDAYLPHGTNVDTDRTDGIVLDEMLPPLLLVMMKCAKGSSTMKDYLRSTLLPASLDRSSAAGPLETRKGTLGNILRLMTCNNHTACRDSAGELMWAICNEDAATLSSEIGYGTAAGILFRKGLAGPPEARIEEISDPTTEARHPITALARDAGDDRNPALEAMTQEEKEREAERLFVLFDRLEKTKMISAQTQGKDTDAKGLKEVMEDKLRSGEFNKQEERLEEEEEKRQREQEDKEEEEAMRDLKEYRKRQGKS